MSGFKKKNKTLFPSPHNLHLFTDVTQSPQVDAFNFQISFNENFHRAEQDIFAQSSLI